MKIIKILIFVCLLLILSGCKSKEYMECKIDLQNSLDNYSLTAVYKIYYEKSFVTKIVKEEKYVTSDPSKLDYINEYQSLDYYNLSDRYGGVEYNIKLEKDKLIINANIDLKKFDIKAMVKDGNIDKDYVISNRLTKGGIKRFYESKGAICKDI